LGKRPKVPITIIRKAPKVRLSPFAAYFKGFDRVDAVRSVFGDETEDVLDRLKIGFVSNKYMYMGVRDTDGNLGVGTYHLKNSDLRTLYLDIVHELFHVKQFMQDRQYFRQEHWKYLKDGFDSSLYFRSPIEIPAYRHAVDEAKRIGMSYDEIEDYLRMGPVDSSVFGRFLKDVGLRPGAVKASRAKIPVRINRKVQVPLFPFTDYFKGLERVPAVKSLFGQETNGVLSGLRLEFSSMPMSMIAPDEDDGHIQVSTSYLEKGDARLLYMDILICLNILSRSRRKGRTPQGATEGSQSYRAMVESYRAAMGEGRRLGLSDTDLANHMILPRFLMEPEDFQRFLSEVGLERK